MFVFIMLNFNLFAENLAEKYSRECEQGDLQAAINWVRCIIQAVKALSKISLKL